MGVQDFGVNEFFYSLVMPWILARDFKEVTIITKNVEISSAPEVVYELIMDVEKLSEYSSVIAEIKKIDNDLYRWKAHIHGLWFNWESTFTKNEKPSYISWRSVTGLKNEGYFNIEPHNNGSKVTFQMEYHFFSILLEKSLQITIEPLIENTFVEILTNIKSKLEEDSLKSNS